jgi:hypothetical protein
MDKQKKPLGRPSMNTKPYSVRIEGELGPILDAQPNKNRFINNSIREKMQREGLLKK